jgi:hypothetical protein
MLCLSCLQSISLALALVSVLIKTICGAEQLDSQLVAKGEEESCCD